MKAFLRQLRPALLAMIVFTVICGVVYPLAVTLAAQVAFHDKAEGSLLTVDGTVVGSELIGQQFVSPQYFHPRPSATAYGTLPSGAGNQGYTSAALAKAVGERRAAWEAAEGTREVPQEMLSASGSGLDPHIGPRAAELQVPRVMRARGLSAGRERELRDLVDRLTEGPQLGFLGEARVNVLALNLALDEAFPR